MSNDDITVKFAKKLKEIRQQRGLSQEDLALLCNIDRTYIGRLERHERKPSLLIADKIAKGLGLDIKELLDFSD
ncbi:MAG: helix-turn-helix transcriptional regulator [Candidatus Gastranaerophilales bacterium]|nr:helix-turn-helix transcriptional regulator [Candidatus Gastranaerophilales bacterium]